MTSMMAENHIHLLEPVLHTLLSPGPTTRLWGHYPTLPYSKLKNHYSLEPDQNRSWNSHWKRMIRMVVMNHDGNENCMMYTYILPIDTKGEYFLEVIIWIMMRWFYDFLVVSLRIVQAVLFPLRPALHIVHFISKFGTPQNYNLES